MLPSPSAPPAEGEDSPVIVSAATAVYPSLVSHSTEDGELVDHVVAQSAVPHETDTATAMSPKERMAYLRMKAEHAERRERAEAAAAAANPFAPRESVKPVRMVSYKVQKGDDLTDLAVRFGCTEASIRSLNRGLIFPVLDNSVGDVIQIPATENFPADSAAPSADVRKRSAEAEAANKEFFAKRQFMEMTGCSEEEAAFYMEEADFNIGAALAAYKDDVGWEKAQAAQKSDKSRKPPRPSASPQENEMQPLVFAHESRSQSAASDSLRRRMRG